jgi:NAD(P)-dependent dehydrogenase (short-subunit alcohol dehydrogenase family)
MDSQRFQDRTCVVSGGGRGIGRAIALALAAEGAAVAVLARTAEECDAVAAEIGERAVAQRADVTNPDDCSAAIDYVTEQFGRVSVLVHAAGVSPVRQRAEVHDLEAFRQIVDVNLSGAFTMARAAATGLLDGGGSVVFVASVLGTIASPRLAGYGASKAGVVQLTRTLAREWADRGVRVNAICPAYVETDLTSALLAVEHLRADIVEQTPMGRLAEIDEVVAPALFLASDASAYITGVALAVDGGMSA